MAGRGAEAAAAGRRRSLLNNRNSLQVTLRAAVASAQKPEGKPRTLLQDKVPPLLEETPPCFLLLQEIIAHPGQIHRQFLLSTSKNITANSEAKFENRSVTISDKDEQMEINISAVTQVGRQLALIGDEFNTTYSGKVEGSLFHLAKGIVASVFQNCFWNSFKNVMQSLGSFLKSGWKKKTDYTLIIWTPLKYGCRKWVPATLFAILMWWLVTYELQN